MKPTYVSVPEFPYVVEMIMHHDIQAFFLTRDRPTVVELWERIALGCREKGLMPPSLPYIHRRVKFLTSDRSRAKRLGPKSGATGSGATQLLDLSAARAGRAPAVGRIRYQLYHTPIRLDLVGGGGRPIGPVYLTLVVDTRAQMAAGFCVSLDATGTVAAGAAMLHAILPKRILLAQRHTVETWPIRGLPDQVSCPVDVSGTQFERACERYGIAIEYEHFSRPGLGRHVERLFRKWLSLELEMMDDSGTESPMTLSVYEDQFELFITRVYHLRRHRANGGVAPLARYEEMVLGSETTPGVGLPESVRNEQELRQAFVPYDAPPDAESSK